MLIYTSRLAARNMMVKKLLQLLVGCVIATDNHDTKELFPYTMSLFLTTLYATLEETCHNYERTKQGPEKLLSLFVYALFDLDPSMMSFFESVSSIPGSGATYMYGGSGNLGVSDPAGGTQTALAILGLAYNTRRVNKLKRVPPGQRTFGNCSALYFKHRNLNGVL